MSAKTASMNTAPKEKKAELTPEQMIQEIRNLRAGNLFVGNMTYVDALLKAYDRVCEAYAVEVVGG